METEKFPVHQDVAVVEYSVFPWGDLDRPIYTVMVKRHPKDGLYYVRSLHSGFRADGTQVSLNEAHGFPDMEDANTLAREVAPRLFENGKTAANHLEWRNSLRE